MASSTTTQPPIDTAPAGETSVARSRRIQLKFPERGDLPALSSVRSSRTARLVAKLLMIGLAIMIATMAMSPWQQTVIGVGSVINFDPAVRPQAMTAPITGTIVRLGDGIREMAFVEKGQLIAEMADLDPERLTRMRNQLENLESAVESSRRSLAAEKDELNRAVDAVENYQLNINTLKVLKQETIASAEALIEVAEQNLLAAQQGLIDKEAKLFAAEQNYRRHKNLYEDGEISSETMFQDAEQKYKSAKAGVEQAKANIAAAKQSVTAKRKDRQTRAESAESSIQLATAALRNAEGKVESSKSKIGKAEQDLQKAINAATEAKSGVRRQENQLVTAPASGYLTTIYADGGSRLFNRGETVARVVPKSEDRVVEIWLDGNDAPLVGPGRHVRLQFDGWPAIQFAGWPSVAVGTFGGEIISVDNVDNGKGRFRALVGEVSGLDETTGLVDEPWPHGRFLRPGVRVKSWVLLETVPLWWEIWRNLNGFPPVVDVGEQDKPKKAPKLPKP